jgi:putative transposase
MFWRHRLMRRPAMNEPGHAHELTFACIHNLAFLKAELTCQWLAESVNEARTEFDFHLWAYVFMPEHVHLMVYPNQPTYDVGAILKAIKEPVGRKAIKHLREHAPAWLPRITQKHGKRLERRFWQPGGGFDHNATDPKVILRMIEYIHGNPVRRRLVSQPEEWKWSSSGWVEGKNSLRPDAIEFGGATPCFGGRE